MMPGTATAWHSPHATPRLEYRGDHTAFERDGYRRRYWLASCTARTPEAAQEWIRRRVWETAVQLDGPAQKIARAWLDDPRAQQATYFRLRDGRPVTLLLSDDQARYEVFVQGLPVAEAGYRVPARPIRQDPRTRHAHSRRKPGIRHRFTGRLAIPTLILAGAFAALLAPH